MGRKSTYKVTKEDSECITDFKKWVESLIVKKKEEKVKQEQDIFDYDGWNSMFDFSLSMEKEQEKTVSMKKHTGPKHADRNIKEKEPASAIEKIPYIYPDLDELLTSDEKEIDTWLDDIEK